MPTKIITETPRTRNEGAYALHKAEARKDGSRFSRRQNHEGHNVPQPAAAVAEAYRELVNARLAQTAESKPEAKTIKLHFIGKSPETGEYVKVQRGAVTRTPELITEANEKFRKVDASGAQLLDKVFLGEEVVRADRIWDALLELCEQEQPNGEAARSLSDSTAMLVCALSGIRIQKDELPAIGAAH